MSKQPHPSRLTYQCVLNVHTSASTELMDAYASCLSLRHIVTPSFTAHIVLLSAGLAWQQDLPYAAVSEEYKEAVEFSHEGTFVRSGIGSKLPACYENSIGRSKLLHGLLNNASRWHCFCLSAVHRSVLSPGGASSRTLTEESAADR